MAQQGVTEKNTWGGGGTLGVLVGGNNRKVGLGI